MKRIILISEGNIFLAQDHPFPVSITTFPENSISFRPKVHQYWEVEATHESGNLTFIVKNYHPTDLAAFNTQKVTNTIRSITFKNLNWPEFERLLASFQRKAILPFLDPSTVEAKLLPVVDGFKASDGMALPNRSELLPEKEEIYEEEVRVSYEEARFGNEYVEFERKFKWSINSITIRVYNPFIKEEFEVIKYYFAKAINGRKWFIVNIKAKKVGQAIEQSATSIDLDKINASLIDSIKITTTKRLFSKHAEQHNSRKVLSVDEIFDNLDEFPNVFRQSETDILSILAELYGLRNKRQLEYLSGERPFPVQKLKFTLKPMFGFLFFIEGTQNDFFCWELLNTNATYLWKIAKNTHASLLSVIEKEISYIHEIGREQYRKHSKESLGKEFDFSFLDHKGIAVNEEDSFAQWKQKVEDTVDERL